MILDVQLKFLKTIFSYLVFSVELAVYHVRELETFFKSVFHVHDYILRSVQYFHILEQILLFPLLLLLSCFVRIIAYLVVHLYFLHLRTFV